jgi:hypothetical protein
MSFREVREYYAGDDVRFIDWKLTARSSNTYVKTFEEDRNVEIVVFIDVTPTLLYGYENISKLQAIIEIVSLLYLLAGETHDLIRVILWGETTINLPPKKGKEGLTLFISVLEKRLLLNSDGKVNSNHPEYFLNKLSETDKLAQIKSYLAKRKEVIYLGDMGGIGNFEIWNKLLDKKNMHCLRVYSPVDKKNKMPFLLKFNSLKNGRSQTDFIHSIEKDPLFNKLRYQEIGVHERYLEKFVKVLV